MNKILIALVLTVVMSWNAYAQNVLKENNYTFDDILPDIIKDKPKIKNKIKKDELDALFYYCDPKVKEKNYRKNVTIAYGFGISKSKTLAEQIFVTNEGTIETQKLRVRFNPYSIRLQRQSGFIIAEIDRTTLKFDRSYYKKECEVVDSWYTLRNKLSKMREKVEEARRKELKF